MRIESIRLKNYKAFRDATLKDIPPFLVVVGANGAGKTTLFDVFGFLHDCLKNNVRHALDSRGRFKEVLSRDSDSDSILIEIQYRMEIAGVSRLVTYSLEIAEKSGVPYVKREILRYKRGAERYSRAAGTRSLFVGKTSTRSTGSTSSSSFITKRSTSASACERS